ncbi:alpha/beta hydrolase family protein [Actinokineospora sp.]|uniref:alpha/beta hydrolase family protein n=1 Tax=Actinokineospora sp. TaxID=1872133 RepID=UPI0040378935
MVTRRSALRGLAALGIAAVAAACATPGPTNVTAAKRLDYGTHPSQFGELTLPTDGAPRGVALLLHGGFWRRSYGLELARPLAKDLAAAGIAAWNVEYRRTGEGGGWPATLDDVAAALRLLAGPGQEAAGGRLDLDRVVAIGHSAGGHLACRLAAEPDVRLRGVVSQAGVLDLVRAAELDLGGGAVPEFLGGTPATATARYAEASPMAHLPMTVPVICVHGTRDDIVPMDQSTRFADAAGAELVTVPGDHFVLIDPATEAWRTCRAAVDRLLT